jgi:hypothetical protein
VLEVVSALGFRELIEEAAAQVPQLVGRSVGAVAEEFLELGEGQLDGIQIGRVRRQVPQFSPDGFDRFANCWTTRRN